ncbi:MAG: alkaline shock response membrane anchor protein AmaP [Verrucomicrobiota bacterium]
MFDFLQSPYCQQVHDFMISVGGEEYYKGLIVIAIVLALLLVWARRPRREIVAFSDKSGEVTVSRRALSELVQETCQALDGVGTPKTKLKARRRRLDLRIHLRLESEGRVEEIRQRLREALDETLRTNLNFTRLGAINITVESVPASKASLAQLREGNRRSEQDYAELGKKKTAPTEPNAKPESKPQQFISEEPKQS